MKLLYVKWVDSSTYGGWVGKNDVFEATSCQTVGWLVSDDNGVLVLAQTIGDDGEQRCNLIGIPKVAITKMKRIKP